MLKRFNSAAIAAILVISMAASFAAGCLFAPPDQGLEAVNEAWSIISRNYVDRTKVNSSNMSAEAIRGMVAAIDDPYSAYLSPEEFQASTNGFQGKFEGIGATVGIKNDVITIVAPIQDSPADKAGIKPGDAILAIDGQSTSGMGVEQAVSLIRGPKGTSVKLLVQHEGETVTSEITIVRAEIQLTSVSFSMKGDIAYIRISHFTEQTDKELLPVLGNITQNGATGIIIDLRSNPGGILNSVVDIASHFIKEGVIVSTVDNKGRKETLSVTPESTTTDLPMVVLTDNYSASGSEVLAGAFQDYGRATIAGTRTYGKGSVDQLFELSDGSGVYLTIGRWLTPKGRMIEGQGIDPDPGAALTLTGDDAVQWAIDLLHNQPH
ncbi:MAG: S41 family peptidase [Dehalococcoidales bacterium]|nr:S41 family peptidase [Dehalococcoidales bacterium]